MGAPYTNQVVLLCVLVFSVATLHMLVGHLRVPGGSHVPRTARNGLSSSSSLRPAALDSAETAIGDALGGAMDGSYEKETGAESDLRFAGGDADPDETDTDGNTEGNRDQTEEDDDVDNDETAGRTKENGGAETDGDRDKDQKDGDDDDDETVDDNREDDDDETVDDNREDDDDETVGDNKEDDDDETVGDNKEDDDDETVDDNKEDDDDETVDDMNKGKKDDDEDDGTNDDSNQDDDETGDANGKEDGDDNNDNDDDSNTNDDGNIANDDGNIANDDGDNNGGSSGSSDKPKPTREEVAASNMAIYNNITSGNTTSLINGLEFVDDVDETGHFVHRLAQPRPVSALKVPTPIFVLSLSKSGTTTVHQYFQCGLGIGASAHHRYPYKKQPKLRYVGKTMRANRIADQPLLSWRPGRDKPEKKKKNRKGGGGSESSNGNESREFTEEELVPDVLEDYQVFSDFDLYRPGKKSIDFMVDNLDNIGRFYPNATILYLNRDAASWYNSAKNFGSLLRRWKNFSVSPLVDSLFGQGGRENLPNPKDPEAEEAWVSFYEKYTELVRGFATGKAGDNDLHLPHNGLNTNHSITYLEIPLDDRTGGVLEETVGLPGECFGHANLGTLDKREKGLKTKGGRPEAHPREWTVNTYAEA